MGLFKNMKAAMEAASQPVDPAEMEARLASLTPEQRAAYEANMAEVARGQAESEASWAAAKAISDANVILMGPAGRHLYGRTMDDADSPEAMQRLVAEQGPWAAVRHARAQNKGGFKDAVKQTLNLDAVPQEQDPDRRAQIGAEERRARDEARAPYRSPSSSPVAISRLATRGRTQLAELLAHLEASGLAARPDLVYGVYRVPDRISGPLTPHSEQGRVVEWDIVHWPVPDGVEAGPDGQPLVATSFAAHEQWVARRVGEPSILDEDLALAFCLRAGIGPERCVGLARYSEVRYLRGGSEDEDLRSLVRGVVAVHPQDLSGTQERMQAEAPLRLDELAHGGVHTEVLNWHEVARVVQPKIHHPPACPSPFPYLPSTPQELLRSYLEVVGLQPSDCYGAQATFDRARPLVQGGLFTTNTGPKQACADGEERMRTRAGEIVVVTYRDRPEYAEGRARWAAYQRDVLQAHLHRGVRGREPVSWMDDSGLHPVLRAAVRASEALEWSPTWGPRRWPPTATAGPRSTGCPDVGVARPRRHPRRPGSRDRAPRPVGLLGAGPRPVRLPSHRPPAGLGPRRGGPGAGGGRPGGGRRRHRPGRPAGPVPHR